MATTMPDQQKMKYLSSSSSKKINSLKRAIELEEPEEVSQRKLLRDLLLSPMKATMLQCKTASKIMYSSNSLSRINSICSKTSSILKTSSKCPISSSKCSTKEVKTSNSQTSTIRCSSTKMVSSKAICKTCSSRSNRTKIKARCQTSSSNSSSRISEINSIMAR